MAGLEAFVLMLCRRIPVGREVGIQELALLMVSWACPELLPLLVRPMLTVVPFVTRCCCWLHCFACLVVAECGSRGSVRVVLPHLDLGVRTLLTLELGLGGCRL